MVVSPIITHSYVYQCVSSQGGRLLSGLLLLLFLDTCSGQTGLMSTSAHVTACPVVGHISTSRTQLESAALRRFQNKQMLNLWFGFTKIRADKPLLVSFCNLCLSSAFLVILSIIFQPLSHFPHVET